MQDKKSPDRRFFDALMREAADSLGEITGEISNAGILEAMFSRFVPGNSILLLPKKTLIQN
jgi:tRNA U34 5-carboxymethylaminomethyl modifying GTPase MnmE/TrmE